MTTPAKPLKTDISDIFIATTAVVDLTEGSSGWGRFEDTKDTWPSKGVRVCVLLVACSDNWCLLGWS